MNDEPVIIEGLVFELNRILYVFSNDSKASKRCFCNRAEPLMLQIIDELLRIQKNANAR